MAKGKFVYQAEIYSDDGTNIEYSTPCELNSNTYFEDEESLFEWFRNNGYDIDDLVVHEYPIADLDKVFDVVIDADGEEVEF